MRTKKSPSSKKPKSSLSLLYNKFNLKSRSGFVFTIPLMLGIGLIIFAAIIAVSQIFVVVGGPLVPELITSMPTFYDYNATTGDIIINATTGNPQTNQRTDLYWLLAEIAIILLIFIGVLAFVAYLFEGIKLIHPGTAVGVLGKIILFLPLFLIFPYLWDIYAISIENFSLFLLDPFDSGTSPADRTALLWQEMGSVLPPGALDIDQWGAALADPGTFGQGLLKDVILGLFKGIAVMFMTAMMFVISSIRILLTMVIVIAIPLILTLGLVPLFRKVKDLLIHNLIGLSIAPIFSALVLTAGIAYLDSTTLPAMQDWFAALSVGFLAVFFPVMLAPILGQITTQVGQMVSTAITTSSVVGAIGAQGALGGMQNAAYQMSGTAASMAGVTGMAGAGAAANAIGSRGTQSPVSSTDIGKMTSGAASLDIPQMSRFDKFKTYTKAATMGAGMGIAAGSVQAASNVMHVPRVGRPVANNILQAGNFKAAEIGQTGVVNHNLNFIDSHMKSMEPAGYHVITEKAVMPETRIPAPIVMNPGPVINQMDVVNTGHQIMENPQIQHEYLDMQHNQIKGFDRFSPTVQAQTDEKILEQLRNHPAAAGRMFEEMSGNMPKTEMFSKNKLR